MNERLYDTLVLPETDLSVINLLLFHLCRSASIDPQPGASFTGTVGEALHHLQNASQGYADIGLETEEQTSIIVRMLALNPECWNPANAIQDHDDAVQVETEQEQLLTCSLSFKPEHQISEQDIEEWTEDIRRISNTGSDPDLQKRRTRMDQPSAERSTSPSRSENTWFTESTIALLREIETKNQSLIHTREQLDEKRDPFDQTNKYRTNIVRQISHDLRTPLHAISGSIDLLRETDLSAEQQQYLDVFERATESMVHLVNNVLDLSRIRSGSFELQEQPVDVKQFLNSSLAYFYNLAEEEQIELRTEISPQFPDVIWADPNRLDQVISNLVKNAINHTEHGEVLVKLDLDSNEAKQGNHMLSVWEVIDTGPGIPEHQQTEIFSPFYQGDQDSSKGGFGLGLTITKHLVERMNGRIQVESQPGNGSTFRFEIPLKRPPQEDHELQKKMELHVEDRSLNGKKMLVADDDPTTRLLLNKLLTSWGASVETLESVQAINDHFRPFPEYEDEFDVIFLNPHMSDLNGLELLDMLNQSRSMDHVIPIASEKYEQKNRQHAAEFNIKYLLTKPVRPERVLETMDAMFPSIVPSESDRDEPDEESSSSLSGREEPVRLLLAEDNEINRSFMRQLFEAHPIDLTCVENGREAVNTFRNTPFDLVLMDLKMPKMDGVDAAREIREFEKQASKQRIPIVALTAETTMDKERKQRLETDFDGHLSKPINVDRILDSIRDQLDTHTP